MTNLGYLVFIFYWRTNEDWYYWDDESKEYRLTEKAPPKAVRSFNAWKRKE